MKNNKGFSLVELIVVIAIMAVLVGVLAPTLLRYVEKSREQKDDSAVAEVVNAVNLALADERILADVTADTVIKVNASGVKVFANASATDAVVATNKLQAELNATITGLTLSSNAHKAKTYTITLTTVDGFLKPVAFDESHWN